MNETVNPAAWHTLNDPKPKHSLAPWRLDPTADGCDVIAADNTIVHIEDYAAAGEPIASAVDLHEELFANCKLIATAPDLLASLMELVNSPNAKQNEMWDRARAAIAKASE